MLLRAIVLGSVVSVLGCSSSADVASDSAAVTSASAGLHDLSAQWAGAKGAAIAVRGGTAYVGLGTGGVAVVDLATLRTLRTYTKDHAGLPLVADGVQLDGDALVVSGLRNEAPLAYGAGSQPVFAVSFLDPATGKDTKQVRIDMLSAISDRDSSIIDLPSMQARIADGQIAVSFVHDRGKKLLRVPVPAGSATLVGKDLLAGKTVPLGYAKDIAVVDGAAYLPEASGADDGYLHRIDLTTGASSRVGAKLGYPVAVAADGDRLLVGDHAGRLLVLDATGKQTAELEVDDFVTGIAVDEGRIFLSTWKGIFVAPQ